VTELLAAEGLLRLALTLLGCVAVLALVRRLPAGSEEAEHPLAGHFPRQLVTAVGGLLATLLVIVALPVEAELRGQLLSLYGIALTALITLSSTTFVANAMAGLMLRSLDNFRAGDFIRVGDHFGRVSERGLLHTEIQTEDRDLVTLPNLFLITQPVRVVHASGTLVTCELSLGYDVPRQRVREQLEAAALQADLTDPFVLVVSLGDHSVVYRVCGFLAEVRTLVSARSRLAGAVLDALHDADIEIVSPNFMNQRVLAPDARILPPTPAAGATTSAAGDHAHVTSGPGADPEATADAERIMFDKAESAARIAELVQERKQLAADLAELEDAREGDAGTAGRRRIELAWRRRQLEALDALLAEAQAPPEAD
jgi:small-conductance mechanosensitive channel